MNANDIHPATSILIPLPTIAPTPNPVGMMGITNATARPAASASSHLPTFTTHYLLVRTTTHGLSFELNRLARVSLDGGVGFKLIIADKVPVDLGLIRNRRQMNTRRAPASASNEGSLRAAEGTSSFEVDNVDLRDLYIYCKWVENAVQPSSPSFRHVERSQAFVQDQGSRG